MTDEEHPASGIGGLPSPLRADLWDVDVVLGSGRVARVRSIRPSDADGLRDLHSRLSAESRLLRFFTPMPVLPDAMVQRFVTVDHRDRVALVVELDEQLIAVGRYDRLSSDRKEAEVAFVVDDDYQGEGIGSLLLEHLAAIGLENDIERFVAETMANNEAMLRVFSSAGFEVKRRLSGGIFDVSFPIEPTERSEQVRERRDHEATVRSLQRLIRPRSVAMLGGAQDALRSTHVLTASEGEPVGAVTPCTELFRGRLLPPGELEDGVDVVVVDTTADRLGAELARCAEVDAGVVVVTSGGFREQGEVGVETERRLARFARGHGMRLLGPESLGVANTAADVGLYLLAAGLAPASDAPVTVAGGHVGVFAHSPELSRQVLTALADRGLGISSFVSAGDKADVSGNDMLEYWEDDPATRVMVLAVESFGNPRRFARLCERVGRSKPIVILAPDDPETAALARRTGVARADSVASLAQTTAVYALHPEWFTPPPANEPAIPPLDADALDAASSRIAEVGVGVLRDADLDSVLAAIGLDGWSGPPSDTVICGRQDPRFGPLVELWRPRRDREVALAPVTMADLLGIGEVTPALGDAFARVGAAMAELPDLAELTVVLTRHDTPATITAIAAPSPNGVTQIVRRLT